MALFTKRSGSYTLMDLAGVWETNALTSGTRSEWNRGSVTIDPVGNVSGSSVDNTGTVAPVSTVLAISGSGIVTDAGAPAFRCALDSGKTVAVCTNTYGDGTTDMMVMTKRGMLQITERYIQSLTTAAGTTRYDAWIQPRWYDGGPVFPSQFGSVSVLDNTGAPLAVTGGSQQFFYGLMKNMNPTTSALSDYFMSGGNVTLAAPVGTLSAGMYTIVFTDNNGIQYPSPFYYPGDFALPAVDNATMGSVFNPDGTVTLSFTSPSSGMDNTMRFTIRIRSNTLDLTGDGAFDILLQSNIPYAGPGVAHSVVVPKAFVDNLRTLYGVGEAAWEIQTRKFYNGTQVSRSYSERLSFPLY